MNPILLTVAVLCGIAGISAVMARSSYKYWVYGFLLCIPIDIGAAIGYFPRLSLMDYLSASGFIALLIRYKPKDLFQKTVDIFGAPVLIAWGLFFLYGVVMAFILHGSPKGIVRWGEFLFVYFVAALAASERDVPTGVASLLAILGSLMAGWALYQYWHFGGNYEKTFALFKQHNGLGAFLSLCLPSAFALFIAQRWNLKRVVFGVSAIFISIAFLAAYSRGAWIGLMGAILFVGILRVKKPRPSSWYVGLGLVLMLVGAAGPVSWVMYRESKGLPVIIDNLVPANDPRLFKVSQRTQYWKAATDVFRAHPWVGLGPKNYDRKIVDHLTSSGRDLFIFERWFKGRIEFWQHLHNIYLQILVEYGLIGWTLWAFALAILAMPLFQPTGRPLNVLLVAFQVSGIAFLLHNGIDILFVNSFDLVVAVMLALLMHGLRPAVSRKFT